jgi:hypothetical protein
LPPVVGLRGPRSPSTDAAQGKTVTGEVSPAVSAGVTAQANGNAVSQSGTATADAQATADTDDATGKPEESD